MKKVIVEYENKFTPTRLEGDVSDQNYGLVYDSAKELASDGIFGMTCEIGVRLGGGSEAIIQGFLDGRKGNEFIFHIGVDPYGCMPYEAEDGKGKVVLDYGQKNKHTFLKNTSEWALESQNFEYILLPFKASDFYQMFGLGIPLYFQSQGLKCNQYALVHIDGEHSTVQAFKDISFFSDRMVKGGYLIIDNIDYMKHDEFVRPFLVEHGFTFIDEYKQSNTVFPAKSRYRKK